MGEVRWYKGKYKVKIILKGKRPKGVKHCPLTYKVKALEPIYVGMGKTIFKGETFITIPRLLWRKPKQLPEFPSLEFKFEEYIDIYTTLSGAVYDPKEVAAYFFCIKTLPKKSKQKFIDELPQSITHETLHYVIHKLEGRATFKFDDIWMKVKEWDEEVYNMLY